MHLHLIFKKVLRVRIIKFLLLKINEYSVIYNICFSEL
uniref:Uncharacterized protein n=1 Tax=Anguilla anguilla TaxID=7936 RepID=A0A0E9S8K9_ANGAN